MSYKRFIKLFISSLQETGDYSSHRDKSLVIRTRWEKIVKEY